MKPKEFARLVARDGHCLHCGETEAIAPNHRANRGMGGKNAKAEVPSNLVVLCSIVNGLLESSSTWATLGKQYGWKLSSWQDPLTEPVFDTLSGEWRLLSDDFSYRVIGQHEREALNEH